jgi:predicted hydrolase (HD superfamily)
MKAGIVEPVEVVIARQRHGSLIFAVTNQHVTVKELVETAFSVRSAARLYSEDQEEKWKSSYSELRVGGLESLVALIAAAT